MVFRSKSRVPKLLMVLAMSILVVYAGTPLKIEASSPFAGGEGTAESPYLIETPEQLSAIRNYSHAHFKLNADIDLSGMSWVPINPFSGVLDGAGYKIIGLTIDSLVGSEVGLFGKTTQTAILKNISLIDVNTEGPKSGTKDDYDYVGALVGRSYGKVINSFASGTVTGYYSVGGLVGTTHGDITHSCADVTVYAPHIESNEIGGLVGTVYGGETTYSCATGDVISNGYNVGGLVGMYFLDLVTLEQGLIRNCYATGNVVADEIVGGLIGQSHADKLHDTYAKGSVTANQYAGGLIGYNFSTEVYNSYSVGKVLPELDEVNYNFSHGFIGHQELFKVYNSFFDMETSGHTYPYAGQPKTTAEMKQRETYLNAEWDFDEVWEIDPLFNDGYPYLKNIQAFITYDGNGHTKGTAPYDGKSYKPGDVVVAKDNEGGLKKTGYIFVGWNTKSDGTGTDYAPGEEFNAREVNVLFAKWLGNPYTVSFDPQGGTVEVTSQEKRYDSPYGLDLDGAPASLPIPEREGYTFLGWYTEPNGQGNRVTDETLVSTMGDHTLYAHWTLSTYDIIFDSMGGSAVDSQQVLRGERAQEPEPPVKTGHTFVGWFTDLSSQEPYDFNEEVTKSITLYAKWNVNQYTVTYDDNGSEGGNVSAPVTQDYGTEIIVSDNTGGLTKTGYSFAGWNTARDGSGESYQPGESFLLGAEDVTLYAQWSINQYTVTYVGNGSDGGDVPAQVIQDYGTEVTVSDNTEGLTKTGYTFVEWNTKPDGSGTVYRAGDTFTLGANDITLYAQWCINQYTVTYDGNGNNDGTVPASVTQDYGTEITVSDNTGGLTKIGYTFVGWNTAPDGSGTSYQPGDTLTLGASDITLYAQWSINQYTVTYDGNGSDGGNVPAPVTQDYDTEVTVSDNTGGLTKVGHTFAGWNTASDGSGTSYQPGESFKLGADNVTLYAQWQKNSYTVSFESNGGSDVASQTVYYGDTVTVPDKPKRSGFVFDSWHINQDLDAPYDFSTPVTGNLTLYAKWRLPDPVAMPKATPSGGAVLPGTSVELSTETTGATIYYTTDETEPTTSSTKYTNPIIVTSEMTIKAIAVKEEMRDSDVLSEHYTMAPIPAPMNLTANPRNESVSLNWGAVQIRDVTYAVYKAEGNLAPNDPNDWELVQTGISSNNFTVTNLTNGTSYVFAVKTIFAGNESDFSNVAQATPVRGTSNSGGSGGSGENIISTDGRITIPVGKSGEIRLGDELILKVSSGAAEQELQITVEKLNDVSALLPEHGKLVSPVYELLKNMSDHFKKPISLTIKFDRSKVSEDQRVAIFYYDEENKHWVEVGGIVEGEHINIEVDHFTKFAVFAVDVKEDKEPKETPKATFSDIAGHWGEQSIIDAASRKLINGYPDGSFKPNNPVTRAEFTAMLVNALQLDETSTDLPFIDQEKIGNWAKPAIAVAAQRGLVKGYEDGSFRPDALITRAEMSVMIARVLGLDTNDISSTKFKDDKDIPQWAKSSVAGLNELGIVNGRGDNKFVPKETATRTEAIVILLRMLEMEN